MAITFGAENHNAKGASDTNPVTITVNVPAGMTNAHAEMFMHLIGAPTQTVSTCTWDGANMTFRSRNTSVNDNFITVEHWYLSLGNSPASGNRDVVVTPSAACRMIGYAVIRNGVHQSTQFSGSDVFNEGTDAAPTNSIASSSGELVVDGACSSGTRTFTDTGGQSVRTNYTPSDTVVGSDEAGGGTTVISWSIDSADVWVSVIWRLNPAPSGVLLDAWHPPIERQHLQKSEIIAY